MRRPTAHECKEVALSLIFGLSGLAAVTLAGPAATALGGVVGILVGVLMCVVGLILVQMT